MKRLLAIASILIPVYLFAQGFGSFSHDQPFLAGNITSSAQPPACDLGAWNGGLNTNTYALYDFNCSTNGTGTTISNLADQGIYNQILTTTNGPYLTNNVAEINNYRYAVFRTNYLMATGQSVSQPYTAFIVSSQSTNPTANSHVIFDNGLNNVQPGSGGYHNMLIINANTDDGYTYGGNFGAEVQAGPYNVPTSWSITEVYFNGATGSYVKTNNVTALSATFAPARVVGTTLGANSGFTQHANNLKIAWAGFYTNTLTATTKSNVYYYLTNRFSIQ